MDREAEAALILQNLQGFSPSIQLKLLAKVGSFATILQTRPESLAQILNPDQQATLKKARARPKHLLALLDRQITTLQVEQAVLLPITAANYPALLRETPTPPPLLFIQGALDILDSAQIAVVGSRRPTIGGANTARKFAHQLTAGGFVITSGLALGIDAEAHRGALQSGKTVAVTGAGIDVVYPKQHLRLYREILDNGGAVVTEFLPGVQPRPQHFPRRNRIISGMSMGVLVVEAALRSGSLITARYALDQGREVFAIPGSIHNPYSRGCHHLIKEGAKLVECVDDIVEELGGMLGYKFQDLPSAIAYGVTAQEALLLEMMGYDPIDIDTLMALSGLTISEVTQQLVSLELKGKVENRDGLFLQTT